MLQALVKEKRMTWCWKGWKLGINPTHEVPEVKVSKAFSEPMKS